MQDINETKEKYRGTRPQEIFENLLEAKAKARELRAFFNDLFLSDPEYSKLNDDKKALLEKMKVIKESIKSDHSGQAGELEDLVLEIKTLNQMLADVLLVKMHDNEQVELKTNSGQLCLPIFTVKLEKVS